MRGDIAYQRVTNFADHFFVSGSFYADTSASDSPVTGHAFSGICYTSDPPVVPPALPANANMVIEARDATDNKLYLRRKAAGVWSVWIQDTATTQADIASLQAAKVAKSGDTMTGPLVLSVGACRRQRRAQGLCRCGRHHVDHYGDQFGQHQSCQNW